MKTGEIGVRSYTCGRPEHSGGGDTCNVCRVQRKDAARIALRQHPATVGTIAGTVYNVRRTLAATLPAGVDCEVRARTSSRVEPGMVRVTLETHDPVKCARRTRAVSRMRAYHWGAFGMGGALGTAVGMFLEALRQGWTP